MDRNGIVFRRLARIIARVWKACQDAISKTRVPPEIKVCGSASSLVKKGPKSRIQTGENQWFKLLVVLTGVGGLLHEHYFIRVNVKIWGKPIFAGRLGICISRNEHSNFFALFLCFFDHNAVRTQNGVGWARWEETSKVNSVEGSKWNTWSICRNSQSSVRR